MKPYKAYCIDLDGTVYRGKEPILETVQFVHHLQQQGIEPFFVTNNASQTPDQVKSKLNGLGIDAKRSHIMTSAMAAAKYIVIIGEDEFRSGQCKLKDLDERSERNVQISDLPVLFK